MKKITCTAIFSCSKKNLRFFPSHGGKILFFLLLLFPLLESGDLFAQTGDWQWGIRGGSNASKNGNPVEEAIVDMDTDKEGNVYFISNVAGGNLDMDGMGFSFYGEHSYTKAALIASYDCNGNHRWSKLISAYSYASAFAIRTDTLGNVYVMGTAYPSEKNPWTGDEYLTHFDTDVVIPYSSDPNTYKKRLFLIRYDTAGNFEQLIRPQDDNITSYEASNWYYRPMDMVVDPDGTQHWYMWILDTHPQGGAPHTPIIEGQALVSGHYVFKYDEQGTYLGKVKLEISAEDAGFLYNNELYINHDPVSDSYYLCGYNEIYDHADESFTIGGQLVESPMFVAKFDELGDFLWLKEAEGQNLISGAFFGRPQLDKQGNIYLSGGMGSFPDEVNLTGLPVEFNDYIAQNMLRPSSFPVLFKMDSQGNLLWGTDADTEAGSFHSYTTINGEKIPISGLHGGISWGSVSYPPVANSGYDIYLARFDKEDGSFIAMDSLGSDYGYDEAPTAIASGPRGNIYVGGKFESQIHLPGETLNTNGSGGTDFFVAKFGQANCNCALPEAKFSYTTHTNGVVDFTYTGSAGYDELEWGFGNGQSTTTTTGNTSHAYSENEEFWVCVTAYNSCGYDTWCTMIEPFLTVEELVAESFTFYPNPVKKQLHINAKEPLFYKLFSLDGKELQSGELERGNNSILFSGLPNGFYMLMVENGQGRRRTVKLMKE